MPPPPASTSDAPVISVPASPVPAVCPAGSKIGNNTLNVSQLLLKTKFPYIADQYSLTTSNRGPCSILQGIFGSQKDFWFRRSHPKLFKDTRLPLVVK